MSELRPCPFCGNDDIKIVQVQNVRYGAHCDNSRCDVLTDPNVTTPEGAAEHWNKRPMSSDFDEIKQEFESIDPSAIEVKGQTLLHVYVYVDIKRYEALRDAVEQKERAHQEKWPGIILRVHRRGGSTEVKGEAH